MEKVLVSEILGSLMGDMSEASLAQKVNVPKATINRILSGRTPDPRVSTLAPIAKYFGVSIEQLLGVAPLPQNLPFNIQNINAALELPFVEIEHIYNWHLGKYNPTKFHEISITKGSSLAGNSYVTKNTSNAMFPKFTDDSYLLVNLEIDPKNEDYVIYYLPHEKSVLFRKLILEGKDKYLCAICPGFSAIKITSNALFLGVVVESRILLK